MNQLEIWVLDSFTETYHYIDSQKMGTCDFRESLTPATLPLIIEPSERHNSRFRRRFILYKRFTRILEPVLAISQLGIPGPLSLQKFR